MLIEWLIELKDQVDRHGIRWGLVLTLYAIYRKERRNYRLDRRDEVHNAYFAAILANQRVIMEKLGAGAECADISNLTKSPLAHHGAGGFIFYWAEKSIAQYARRFTNLNMRRISMNSSSINWITLIPALVGALKLILQPFGVDLSHITDSQVNDVANGVAALLTIIGVFMSHKKGDTSNVVPKSNVTYGSEK